MLFSGILKVQYFVQSGAVKTAEFVMYNDEKGCLDYFSDLKPMRVRCFWSFP
jgi:hypothetical protein